jgi:hypothetical protein
MTRGEGLDVMLESSPFIQCSALPTTQVFRRSYFNPRNEETDVAFNKLLSAHFYANLTFLLFIVLKKINVPVAMQINSLKRLKKTKF